MNGSHPASGEPHAHDHPHDHPHDPSEPLWKHDGVRVIPGDRLDGNTAQTPGMDRKAAINFARVGPKAAPESL